MVGEMWVLEYSPSQGQFHLELARTALANNRRRFMENPHEENDWIPLHLGTKAGCEKLMLMSEKYLENFGSEHQWYRQMH